MRSRNKQGMKLKWQTWLARITNCLFSLDRRSRDIPDTKSESGSIKESSEYFTTFKQFYDFLVIEVTEFELCGAEQVDHIKV